MLPIFIQTIFRDIARNYSQYLQEWHKIRKYFALAWIASPKRAFMVHVAVEVWPNEQTIYGFLVRGGSVRSATYEAITWH